MSTDSKKQLLKAVKTRKYLNKDFDSLKSSLLEYARIHFPDKIKDFSESSLGGLLLEMPAYVGDVLSFYLDHQFHELNPETAVEARNIQGHLKSAGVAVVGSSPAVVNTTISLEVPAAANVLPAVPDPSAIPYIYAGTTAQAQNSIQFELTEDIDFAERDEAGNLTANIKISSRDVNNNPATFILEKSEFCISGFRATESFNVNNFEAFKKFTLAQENVTDIVSVKDSLGNTYYEVGFLTQDTIFQSIPNLNEDGDLVKENLQIIPCPYRFIKEMDIDTRLTTLTFGGGSADSLDDDIVPDPSEFALPLYGKKTFDRFTINPATLLQTTTLGVIGTNTTITIEYRYGGGLSHNVNPDSIRNITNLLISFPGSPTPAVAGRVRQSLSIRNDKKAGGGEDAPNLDELKLKIPGSRAAQSRIVSKEDLLARVYTMPSNLGRVFRASYRSNPNNPLASILYVISRDSLGNLTISPDSLKNNLSKYLNPFRVISNAIDILDAQVIDLQLEFTIVSDPGINKAIVLNSCLSKLKKYFNIKNFEIDQPISLDDVRNIIYNTPGVIGVQSIKFRNIQGSIGNREYSDVSFDVESNIYKGLLIGPPGSIFEIKFKDFDLIGSII